MGVRIVDGKREWYAFFLQNPPSWFTQKVQRWEVFFANLVKSRTQAGPGRTVKQEQEDISPNHVQRINLIFVHENTSIYSHISVRSTHMPLQCLHRLSDSRAFHQTTAKLETSRIRKHQVVLPGLNSILQHDNHSYTTFVYVPGIVCCLRFFAWQKSQD